MSNKCDREASKGEAMTRNRVKEPGWERPLTFSKRTDTLKGSLANLFL